MSDSTQALSGLGDPPRPDRPAGEPRSRQRRGLRGRIAGIGTFYRQVVAELRKVIWPNRQELLTYTSVVLVFVLIMVSVVSIFDFLFGQAVLHVFGQ